MRHFIPSLAIAALLSAAAFTASSCRNGNSNNEQIKEKVIDQDMRTDSMHQDHTAVADSTEHNGGMNAGGK